VRSRFGWFSAGVMVILVLGGAGGASAGSARQLVGSQTFTVNVDGHNPAANESFIAYYPNVVRVHPGDTIVFHQVGNGEPHTVTLGTLVDNVLSQFEQLKPAQRNGPPPKSLLQADALVPQLLPQGPGDAIPSGANPCYVSSGLVSSKNGCPRSLHAHVDFNGRQSYFNSGWLNSNAKWAVHLSSSTAPGIYHFMCELHREGMTGKVVVAPWGTTVPSPSAQFAAGQKKLAATEAKLAPAVTAERQGKLPLPKQPPGTGVVLAGSGSPSVQEAAIDEFGPRPIQIGGGESVTWWLLGPHTITFDSNKTNNDIRAVAPDGTVHLNPKALLPAAGPGEPHGPGGQVKGLKFKVVAATSWNGQGFHNSGIFTNSFGPPLIEGYKITFTRAGTYKYICTVHDDMKGTVVVS
jgi:plastocyanin